MPPDPHVRPVSFPLKARMCNLCTGTRPRSCRGSLCAQRPELPSSIIAAKAAIQRRRFLHNAAPTEKPVGVCTPAGFEVPPTQLTRQRLVKSSYWSGCQRLGRLGRCALAACQAANTQGRQEHQRCAGQRDFADGDQVLCTWCTFMGQGNHTVFTGSAKV